MSEENTEPPKKKIGRPRKYPAGATYKEKQALRVQASVEAGTHTYYDRLGRPREYTGKYEHPEQRRKLFDSRVEYVADLMRELKYRTGVTAKSLASIWNLPLQYVAEITTAASRRVRAELFDDADRIASKVGVSLDRVIDDAFASGDLHAVIKAVQIYAQVTGVGAATRVAVTQDLSAMTPEQIQARKAEILAKLQQAKPAALPPKPGDE